MVREVVKTEARTENRKAALDQPLLSFDSGTSAFETYPTKSKRSLRPCPDSRDDVGREGEEDWQ